MMQYEPMDAAAGATGLTGPVRATLADIVAGLDARFMQAGEILETTIVTIDRVVQGLDGVGRTFEGGAAGAAVDNLSAVAHRLTGVPEQQALRSSEIAAVRAISRELNGYVAEVDKALEVLKIYGINVKIAASGAEDFVDFAIRMQRQLEAGGDQIKGFGVKLAELELSLEEMETSDRWLMRECAKVVPEVPERLASDAAGLREQQAKLCALAAQVRAIAQAIQGNVAAILGAIQIGDITRQRLEHVLDGCARLDERCPAETAPGAPGHHAAAPDATDAPATDARAATDDGASDATTDALDALVGAESGTAATGDGSGARGHMLRLFSAQLFDTAENFGLETEKLIASLRDMGPQAAQLLAFGKGKDSLSESRVFLRRVEAGVARADAMTLQLRNADRQVESVISLILDTVNDLEARARKVRDLRIDVQQMAINIGLRCRHAETVGRPVIVIANEIRSYSEKLDSSTSGIIDAAGKLGSVSLTMREQGEREGFDSEDALSRSISAIGEGAERTESAMAATGSEAGEIVGMLRDIGEQLGSSLALRETIEQLAATLGALAGPEETPDDAGDAVARSLMEELARSYTMAREREVHDRFLLPGMTPTASAPSGSDGLDDDDLFEDALF